MTKLAIDGGKPVRSAPFPPWPEFRRENIEAVVVRGATPVMAEVDRDSQTITVQTVENALTARTKAIIAVHLAGCSCDMDPIKALAASRGLKVVEDLRPSARARAVSVVL